MKSFVLGVLSSILGGIILVVLATLSRRLRIIMISLSSWLSGVGIQYVYKNKTEASSDLDSIINNAKNISILTSRGNEFQREVFSSIFLHRPEKRDVNVRILLPNTSLGEGLYDWTAQREKELSIFDMSFGDSLLHKQVDTNVSFLDSYISKGRIELRRYNLPHIGRILIIDDTVFFSPYSSDSHGRDSQIFRFSANSV